MIIDDLATYRHAVQAALVASFGDVAPDTLRRAALHYPEAGGKRLRPVITLLAADACAPDAGTQGWERAMPAALAVELVHTFSLVHDDIMDEDDIRRGQPTVHAEFGTPLGILAGDVQFAKAFELLAVGIDADRLAPVMEDVARTVRVLCEGQALDMAFEAREEPPSVEEYLHMIGAKTGSLFATAARTGALAVGAPRKAADALGAYGMALGLAFQVRDDVIDVTQDTLARGKERYADIKRGKQTYLVLHALAEATPEEQGMLLKALGNEAATQDDLARAAAALATSGAFDAARTYVEARTADALDALADLPESDARARLTRLAEWAAGREK